MSEQIIKVLEYLSEKFGIAVDWTTENVVPYAKELAERLVKYNIVRDILFILLSLLSCVASICLIKMMIVYFKKASQERKANILYDYICNTAMCSVFSGLVIVAIIMFCVIGFIGLWTGITDIAKWMFIPELQIAEYISQLIQSM